MNNEIKQNMTEEEKEKVATYKLLRDVYKTKYPGKYKNLVAELNHMTVTLGTEAMLFILMDEVRKLGNSIKSND